MMDYLGLILMIIFAFFVGRIYEYRVKLRECENCVEGFKK
ncbi:putative membrane protein [Clostridioides difficile CD160]|nr:putative membrane protein [Clostridioides difficile CD160]